jgi:hypothetical protein
MQEASSKLAQPPSNGPTQFRQAPNSWGSPNGAGQQSYAQLVIGSSDGEAMVNRRKAFICVPPALAEEVLAKGQESPLAHPVWAKAAKRNRYFVITADSLDDLTEIADFARVELEEPEHPLTKARRHAFQALLDRTHRYAILEPLGEYHCVATAWRDQPLRSNKASSRVVTELRQAKVRHGLTPWF